MIALSLDRLRGGGIWEDVRRNDRRARRPPKARDSNILHTPGRHLGDIVQKGALFGIHSGRFGIHRASNRPGFARQNPTLSDKIRHFARRRRFGPRDAPCDGPFAVPSDAPSNTGQARASVTEPPCIDAAGVAHPPAGDDARIVSLVPSLTELLFDLGLGDQVVGRTAYCRHPRGRVRAAISVGGTKRVDMAKLEALRPSHVIVNVDETPKGLADACAARGAGASSLPTPSPSATASRCSGCLAACSDGRRKPATSAGASRPPTPPSGPRRRACRPGACCISSGRTPG